MWSASDALSLEMMQRMSIQRTPWWMEGLHPISRVIPVRLSVKSVFSSSFEEILLISSLIQRRVELLTALFLINLRHLELLMLRPTLGIRCFGVRLMSSVALLFAPSKSSCLGPRCNYARKILSLHGFSVHSILLKQSNSEGSQIWYDMLFRGEDSLGIDSPVGLDQ